MRAEGVKMEDLGIHYYVSPDEDDEAARIYCPNTRGYAMVVFTTADCRHGKCSACEEVVKVNKD